MTFGLEMDLCLYCFILHEGPVWYRTVWALCMLPQLLWVHLCTYHVNLEDLVFLVFSISSISYPLTSSSGGFSDPWEIEVFDGAIPFGSGCSNVSQCLHPVWLWVSFFVLIWFKGSISDDDHAKHRPISVVDSTGSHFIATFF